MQSIHRYRSLEQVLLALKEQVRDSMPEAAALNLRGTPEQIFNALRSRLIYTRDPDGRELLQELSTLLNTNGRNFHGLAGAGDCDCFTIAALACLLNAGYSKLYVVLTGNSYSQPPVHIFVEVARPAFDKLYTFDLTQGEFNSRRPYNYFQRIPFSL